MNESNTERNNKQFNDFYKLHYPNRKLHHAGTKISNQMRSKSVVSVIQQPIITLEEIEQFNPKGSISKMIANKQSKQSTQKQKYRIKQSYNFKTALSSKGTPNSLSSANLPVNNMKQLEQFSKNNLNVRLAMQRAKDEKIKMNKIIMSHKQNEQVKLEYLKSKRQQTETLINQEISSIYQQFFRKQYEAAYGIEESEDKFQAKLAELVSVLSKKIFSN